MVAVFFISYGPLCLPFSIDQSSNFLHLVTHGSRIRLAGMY